MPEMIVIEVDCDPALYPKVNASMGLDPNTGAGDWPKGLITHVGGGGEARVYKGLGVGGELGFLFPRQEFLYGAGLLSVNTLYRWNTGTHWKVQPFVTGGYSLLFRGFAENRLNFGGGLTYWMSERAGLRVEYRQYEAVRYRDSIRELRLGLALR